MTVSHAKHKVESVRAVGFLNYKYSYLYYLMGVS